MDLVEDREKEVGRRLLSHPLEKEKMLFLPLRPY